MKSVGHFLLHVGLIAIVVGVLLRLTGYNQTQGITGVGLTPRAFLMFAGVMFLASAAWSLCDIRNQLVGPCQPDSDQSEEQQGE